MSHEDLLLVIKNYNMQAKIFLKICPSIAKKKKNKLQT
jgi:hypothetical protein